MFGVCVIIVACKPLLGYMWVCAILVTYSGFYWLIVTYNPKRSVDLYVCMWNYGPMF